MGGISFHGEKHGDDTAADMGEGDAYRYKHRICFSCFAIALVYEEH